MDLCDTPGCQSPATEERTIEGVVFHLCTGCAGQIDREANEALARPQKLGRGNRAWTDRLRREKEQREADRAAKIAEVMAMPDEAWLHEPTLPSQDWYVEVPIDAVRFYSGPDMDAVNDRLRTLTAICTERNVERQATRAEAKRLAAEAQRAAEEEGLRHIREADDAFAAFAKSMGGDLGAAAEKGYQVRSGVMQFVVESFCEAVYRDPRTTVAHLVWQGREEGDYEANERDTPVGAALALEAACEDEKKAMMEMPHFPTCIVIDVSKVQRFESVPDKRSDSPDDTFPPFTGVSVKFSAPNVPEWIVILSSDSL